LSLYRTILQELRLQNLHAPLRQEVLKYLSSQFKRYSVTEEKFCRANESALFAARAYLTLLQSSRHHEALSIQYAGKGERTIAQAANLVGLSLPKTST